MRNLILGTALVLAALPALAEDAALAKDTMLGKTEGEVRASLVKMGYDVRKIEDEDGAIEAYAVKDKTMTEVYVSPETGKVTKLVQN